MLVALPLFITSVGFPSGFVGNFVGIVAASAMAARFLAGSAADRFGTRPFLAAGALGLALTYLLYLLIPLRPFGLEWTGPALVFLLSIALVTHDGGLGTFGTTASTYVAAIAPAARRGEAVGYFGVIMNLATAASTAVSLIIVGLWGFPAVFGLACLLAGGAAVLTRLLPEIAREHGTARRRIIPEYEVRVLTPSLVNAALMVGYGVVVAFVPLFGAEQGIANPGAFFSVYAATMIAGRAVAGRLVDSHGRIAVAVPGLALSAVGLWLLEGVTSTETLGLAAVFYGAGAASAGPALMALSIDLAGPDRRGSAMGTYTATYDVGITAGAVFSGMLLPALGYAGIFSLAALLLDARSRRVSTWGPEAGPG